jgi:hypothetical protein
MKFQTQLQVSGRKFSKMVVCILDTSRKVNPMAMVFISQRRTKKFTLVNGSLTSDMAKAILLQRTVLNTKVSGRIV